METKNASKMKLVAASVAGLLAAGTFTVSAASAEPMAQGGNVPCYGVNACKGTGDCGGKGYSCAGKNECKGQGFISLPQDTCTRIQGGKLTAE